MLFYPQISPGKWEGGRETAAPGGRSPTGAAGKAPSSPSRVFSSWDSWLRSGSPNPSPIKLQMGFTQGGEGKGGEKGGKRGEKGTRLLSQLREAEAEHPPGGFGSCLTCSHHKRASYIHTHPCSSSFFWGQRGKRGSPLPAPFLKDLGAGSEAPGRCAGRGGCQAWGRPKFTRQHPPKPRIGRATGRTLPV